MKIALDKTNYYKVIDLDSLLEYIKEKKNEEYILKYNIPFYDNETISYKTCLTNIEDLASVKEVHDLGTAVYIERENNHPIHVSEKEFPSQEFYFEVKFLKGYKNLVLTSSLDNKFFKLSELGHKTYTVEKTETITVDLSQNLEPYEDIKSAVEEVIEGRIDVILNYTNFPFEMFSRGYDQSVIKIEKAGSKEEFIVPYENIVDYKECIFLKVPSSNNLFKAIILDKSKRR